MRHKYGFGLNISLWLFIEHPMTLWVVYSYFVHNKIKNASGEEVDILFNTNKEVDADLKLLSEYLSKKVDAYNPILGTSYDTFHEQLSKLERTFAFRSFSTTFKYHISSVIILNRRQSEG